MMLFNNKWKNCGYTPIRKDPYLVWDICKELGEGSFAKVYLTKRKSDGLFAALKSLKLYDEKDEKGEKKMDKEKLKEVINEVKIMINMDCPNIVKFMDAYQDKNNECIINLFIEYCDRNTLDSVIKTLFEATEEQIKAVLYQVCCGLEHMHSRWIIHRDIKSLNILLTSQGDVKLADFGISAMCEEGNMRRSTFMGSINWVAPEVLNCYLSSVAVYDEKCDIWSMGMTAKELAEQTIPFSELSEHQITHSLSRESEPRLVAGMTWSSDFRDFISKTIQRNTQIRLSAKQCIDHPFLNCPDAHSKEPILELLSMNIQDEIVTEPNNYKIDIPDFPDLPPPEKNLIITYNETSSNNLDCENDSELSPIDPLSTSQDSTESVPKNIPPAFSASKTVRRTVKYTCNGKTKTKTFLKVVENENTQVTKKLVKDIDGDQKDLRKRAKIEQKQRKVMETQNSTFLSELSRKHQNEKSLLEIKVRKELEQHQKCIQKEVDKWLSSNEIAQTKQLKSTRNDLASKKKSISEKLKEDYKENKKEAKKLKKSKIELSELKLNKQKKEEEDWLNAAQSTKEEWNSYIIEQQNSLKVVLELQIEKREAKVDELEKELWTLEVNNLIEFNKQKSKCDLMMRNLTVSQYKFRSIQEQYRVVQYQSKRTEDLETKQIKEQKDAPKLLRNKYAIDLENYKKTLFADKGVSKSERKLLLLQRTEDEKANMKSEIAEIEIKQKAALKSLHDDHQTEMTKMVEFQDQIGVGIFLQSMERVATSEIEMEKEAAKYLSGLRERKVEISRIKNSFKDEMNLIQLKKISVSEFH